MRKTNTRTFLRVACFLCFSVSVLVISYQIFQFLNLAALWTNLVGVFFTLLGIYLQWIIQKSDSKQQAVDDLVIQEISNIRSELFDDLREDRRARSDEIANIQKQLNSNKILLHTHLKDDAHIRIASNLDELADSVNELQIQLSAIAEWRKMIDKICSV